jgi:2-polyprenyl-6-methoxyphenol hydroxylase-like FAD-dependent oxidoreductase
VVNAHLGYATRLYRRRRDPRRDWEAVFLQAAPPDQTRAGIAFPIEGDQWIVTLCGGDKDYAPVNEAEFLAFAKSLPDPRVAEIIESSEPLTDITGYRRMENRWRRYDRLRRRPEGFIVLGDAVCAFNPVYGQGMTVAALGAETLQRCLAVSRGTGLATRFQKSLAKVLRTPWTLATGEDVRYRGVEGAQPGIADRFMQWYVDRVVAASLGNRAVRRRLLRVFTMLSGPEALFSPVVLAASLFRAVAGSYDDAERVKAPPEPGLDVSGLVSSATAGPDR